MAYYDALIAAWPSLTGTTAQKLAALNAQTVAGPNQDVPVSAIEGYLSLSGVLSAMEDWIAANTATTPARIAMRELLRTVASPHVMTFATSNASTYAAVQSMLTAVQAAGLLTAPQVAAMLSMVGTTQPWWQANGYTSPLSLNDLVAAGNLT